jgi:acyl-CoA thioesterase-1
MNFRKFFFLILGGCFHLVISAAQAQTIMPFGDSVTVNGSSPESSYRYWLYHYLKDAGYDNIDFVGSHSGVGDGEPEHADFDQDYEGGDGWTTSDALYVTQHGVAGEAPDIVLLDFGANDIIDLVEPDTITTNLVQIMESFRAANPDVFILLAQPTHWFTTDLTEKKALSKLNGAVSKAAKAEKRAGGNVVLVNLSGSFSPRSDTKDGTHPNVKGEQKIAKRYFSAIKKVLRR